MLSDSTEGKADEWFAVNSLDINTRTATGSRSSQALKGNIGTPGADKAALVVALTSGKPPTTPSMGALVTAVARTLLDDTDNQRGFSQVRPKEHHSSVHEGFKIAEPIRGTLPRKRHLRRRRGPPVPGGGFLKGLRGPEKTAQQAQRPRPVPQGASRTHSHSVPWRAALAPASHPVPRKFKKKGCSNNDDAALQ